MAKDYLRQCTKTEDYPLPLRGQTLFYIFTIDQGILTTRANECDLGYNRHKLSPLFHKAQELIATIQIPQEQRKQ